MLKDLLTTADLTSSDVTSVLDLARDLKHHPERRWRHLAGGLVVVYLTEPSTRTRVTFSTAATRLGATVVVLGPGEFQQGHGASVDTLGRIVSIYASVIVARTDDASLRRLAERATIPVVNGLSDHHHPCQSLADLLTLREEFGDLAGRRIAYIGDGDSAAHSLIQGCALSGSEIRVVTPAGRPLEPAILDRALATAARSGGAIVITDDPAEAVAGADAIYSSTWSFGEPSGRRGSGLSYPVTDELIGLAEPHAVLLHHQQRSGSLDGARTIFRHARSRVREQAGNRLHTAAAMVLAAHQRRLTGHHQPALAGT